MANDETIRANIYSSIFTLFINNYWFNIVWNLHHLIAHINNKLNVFNTFKHHRKHQNA